MMLLSAKGWSETDPETSYDEIVEVTKEMMQTLNNGSDY